MNILDEEDRKFLGHDVTAGDMEIVYARREDDGTVYATIRPRNYKAPSERVES